MKDRLSLNEIAKRALLRQQEAKADLKLLRALVSPLIATLEAQANLGLVPEQSKPVETPRSSPKASDGYIARPALIDQLAKAHPDLDRRYIEGRVSNIAYQRKDYPQGKRRGFLTNDQAEFITKNFEVQKKGSD